MLDSLKNRLPFCLTCPLASVFVVICVLCSPFNPYQKLAFILDQKLEILPDLFDCQAKHGDRSGSKKVSSCA